MPEYDGKHLQDLSVNQYSATFDTVLRSNPEDFVAQWLAEMSSSGSNAATARGDAQEVLRALHDAVRADGDATRFDDRAWDNLRGVLASLSQSRAAQGATAGETSLFVLSIKKPLFGGLHALLDTDPRRAFETIWVGSTLVDQMAQFTATTYQRSREEVINRQQQELLELSTPVIKLWEGVLAVPMIGTLDSSRTQLVMEALLTRIVETGSELAIIDITGVPTVDTLVAQHLLRPSPRSG